MAVMFEPGDEVVVLVEHIPWRAPEVECRGALGVVVEDPDILTLVPVKIPSIPRREVCRGLEDVWYFQSKHLAYAHLSIWMTWV